MIGRKLESPHIRFDMIRRLKGVICRVVIPTTCPSKIDIAMARNELIDTLLLLFTAVVIDKQVKSQIAKTE